MRSLLTAPTTDNPPDCRAWTLLTCPTTECHGCASPGRTGANPTLRACWPQAPSAMLRSASRTLYGVSIMFEVEVKIPFGADILNAEQVIEACCAAEGLSVSVKRTLVSYPGYVHWHFKRAAQRGTLEVTWWPQARRAWISVHANRTGEWIEEAVARLKEAMEGTLAESGT